MEDNTDDATRQQDTPTDVEGLNGRLWSIETRVERLERAHADSTEASDTRDYTTEPGSEETARPRLSTSDRLDRIENVLAQHFGKHTLGLTDEEVRPMPNISPRNVRGIRPGAAQTQAPSPASGPQYA